MPKKPQDEPEREKRYGCTISPQRSEFKRFLNAFKRVLSPGAGGRFLGIQGGFGNA
jgi:hypothetical protein